jgi:hypothetical protein
LGRRGGPDSYRTSSQPGGGAVSAGEELYLDQTPSFDLTEGEPVPDFSFDQSLPDDFED